MNKRDRLVALNKESYERIAETFSVTRSKKSWDVLASLAAEVREGSSVLDLGCGNGRLLKALPNVNFSYTGIDSNPYLLSVARERYPDRQFVQESLETLELHGSHYDSIYCIATLHHLADESDRLSLLKKCNAALKPGGILFVTVWDLWQQKFMKYYLWHYSWKISWNDMFIPWRATQAPVTRYVHAFTASELKRLFKKAGFDPVSLRRETGNYIVRVVKG